MLTEFHINGNHVNGGHSVLLYSIFTGLLVVIERTWVRVQNVQLLGCSSSFSSTPGLGSKVRDVRGVQSLGARSLDFLCSFQH